MTRLLKFANLAMIVAWPIAWTAPLMRAGFLPIFRLSEISVLSGLHALWESDIFLALVVFLFALVAPMTKTLALAAVQFNAAPAWLLPILTWVGRLAMADVFLIAVYVVIAKGVGVGRVEVAWGLYFFTALILMQFTMSWFEEARRERA